MQIEIRMAEKPDLKPNMYRLYLSVENAERVLRICKKAELSQAELLSKIAVAGLKAIEENEMRITLPLKFKIEEEQGVRYKQRETASVMADKKR